MKYDEQLQFFNRMMEQLDLPCITASVKESIHTELDMGLRRSLGKGEEAFRDWYDRMRTKLQDRTVFYITDEFRCRYIAVLLDKDREKILIVGPYTLENIDRNWILEYMAESGLKHQWLPVLENFYHRIRFLHSDQVLVVAVQALTEHIWGVGNYKTEHFVRGVPESWAPITANSDEKSRDDILDRVNDIERRYDAESRLMELVRQGRTEKVKLMLGNFSRAALERRVDPTRDVRNYSIILNTLMRKAVQQGGVHPVYIDRVSSDYARRIESINQWDGFAELWAEMAMGYCALVRRHATDHYSPMIRKVITRIDFDITADLSLRSTANALNVNASYLSNQFRKETGETLTDFVNRKRMEHAAYLLTTTDSSVAAVAQSCGISDDNYFTKMFKRHNGLTPRQFRAEKMKYSP